MVPVIQKPLGDVGGMNPVFPNLFFSAEHAFMHAGPVVGQFIVGSQPFLDVIGVQDGDLAGLPQPLGPQ